MFNLSVKLVKFHTITNGHLILIARARHFGLIATGYVLAGESFVNYEKPLLAPPVLLKPKCLAYKGTNLNVLSTIREQNKWMRKIREKQAAL